MQATETPPIPSQAGIALEKNHRILVVDDNEAIHDDFRKILCLNAALAQFDSDEAELFGSNPKRRSRADFELAFATQGPAALEMVRAAWRAGRRYAVVFMDVRMPPGWDGLDTTLKLWKVDPDLQVVICTAYSDKSWEEMSEKVDHPERLLILKKPFDSIEVLQLAHALTEKWALLQAVRHDVEELERTVSRRTQEITAANALLEAEVAGHKRAEERIGELTALLDKAQDAIMVNGEDQRILYWNKGAERIYGWTAEEAIGRHVDQLLFKQEPAERSEALRKVRETGEWAGELRQVTKDGKPILVESRWTMIYDAEGRPKAKMGINTDITEKRKLAAQVLRMQRIESIGTLAGGVAHDLNNALSPIVLGLELLRLRFPEQQHESLFNTLDLSARRGREIVRQILSFASGVEGDHTIVSLRDLILEQERICRNSFYKMIDIITRVPENLWAVQGDATQLHQVLMNLCVNARDAMPAGGTLTVTATNVATDASSVLVQHGKKSGPYVLVTVSDTGTGISPEVMERIFDPFFTTKAAGKGTGLGLSTVLGIVQQHGGFVDATSEPGAGAQFRVYLPATPTKQPGPVVADPAHLPAGNHECILVVDDEQPIRDVVKVTLEVQGYRVLTASGGGEAITLFTERHDEISAVITDISMPVIDGPAAIRAMQKVQPGVKIIAMSGILEKSRMTEASTGSPVSFLQKPFTGEKLLTRLHEVLTSTP